MDRDAPTDAPTDDANPTPARPVGGAGDSGGAGGAPAPGEERAARPQASTSPASADHPPMAVRVMGDRILCAVPTEDDRRSKSGIIIPATAKTADRRGLWATAEEVGPLARSIERGDRVLFLPDAAIEVDVRGEVYLIVRERDVHAVASGEREVSPTGLYL